MIQPAKVSNRLPTIGAFEVETLPLDSLQPADYNPRKIRKRNLEALVRELREFGLVEPIVANRRETGELVIVGGHQRVAAARAIGWESVPVHVISVTLHREKALNLALNNPTLQGEWDDDRLRGLLGDLPVLEAGLAGFDEAALARISGAHSLDDDVPPAPKDPRTKLGELVELGPHRLLCGDARQEPQYRRLMGEAKAACLWTDPPYGVSYVGKTKRKLEIAGDGHQDTENLLGCAFGAANNHLVPGAALYVCSPPGSMEMAFLRAFTSVPWVYRQGLIWRKGTMVLGHADYHYSHEPILYGFTPNGNGRRGRGGDGWYGGADQTSVFDVPRPKASREHPTMKPVALIEQCMRNSTRAGDLVLDPFGGSGSTLIAAHRLGRRAFLMEIDPAYCDVIRDRYAAACGAP